VVARYRAGAASAADPVRLNSRLLGLYRAARGTTLIEYAFSIEAPQKASWMKHPMCSTAKILSGKAGTPTLQQQIDEKKKRLQALIVQGFPSQAFEDELAELYKRVRQAKEKTFA
jgi:hypothetical protein